ncbi:(d)CMP kinase [Tenacibaculum sp. SG-28]|uniref:(d)CMP kinase n=1 Tax=Tenacibaculum sp. SG-28 TaxID=754426 RepID=UPI000CF53EF1|nr:(d)CMP kinase [Tenacibaculum sp. SG-28]PQJ23105.1 cytidylate kinase [Tenacibaculum sp. SG-28]
MTKKITIAIDGFSSTGKSTIAKQLAKELSYIYVDTGAMYRAVTLYAMENNFVSETFLHTEKLISKLPTITLSFHFNKDLGFAEMYLNGKNVERAIRTIEVSNLVSKIAAISAVRKKLVAEQQEMGKNKGIVMDGRDIGTVVFPDAELKIFMTASAETRAQRRFQELVERGDQVSFEAVLHNVKERDHLDSTRSDSPLVKAKDAIAIDNSKIDKDEQFSQILSLVNDKLS